MAEFLGGLKGPTMDVMSNSVESLKLKSIIPRDIRFSVQNLVNVW